MTLIELTLQGTGRPIIVNLAQLTDMAGLFNGVTQLVFAVPDRETTEGARALFVRESYDDIVACIRATLIGQPVPNVTAWAAAHRGDNDPLAGWHPTEITPAEEAELRAIAAADAALEARIDAIAAEEALARR